MKQLTDQQFERLSLAQLRLGKEIEELRALIGIYNALIEGATPHKELGPVHALVGLVAELKQYRKQSSLTAT